MITDEQIARVFNKHGANFFAGARELIALAQQEPAQAVPVAWMVTRAMAEPTLEWAKPKKHSCLRYEPLYTHTAPLNSDTRKPLTDEQIMAIGRELGKQCKLGGNPNIDFDYARAIEKAHGIGAGE